MNKLKWYGKSKSTKSSLGWAKQDRKMVGWAVGQIHLHSQQVVSEHGSAGLADIGQDIQNIGCEYQGSARW